MAIDQVYRELLTEDFIKDQLSRGVTVSALDVQEQIDTDLATKDLTIPQFIADNNHVERIENSSASKNNNTFLDIRQDIRVLYKSMIELTRTSVNAFERWGLEAFSIEKKLIDIQDRIENLLLLTQDTEGYHSIIVDNFTDTSKVDLDFSTAEVDIECAAIEIVPKEETFARIFLNNLELPEDVTFKVRSTVNFLSRVDAVDSILSDPFKQESKTWWSNITMKARGPVVTELTIRLDPDGPISLNRIFLELHDSAEASPVSITPLYTIDRVSFTQLPTNTFTIEAKNTAVFSFSTVKAQWIKFLLTKRGPDTSSGGDFFDYQFGFKNIRFFTQGFEKDSDQFLVTKSLSIVDPNSPTDAVTFEKLTLETCERIEEGTSINYFITSSNNPTVPLTVNTNINETAEWFPISPVGRTTSLYPVILDVGDIKENTFGAGNGSNIFVSYEGRATNPDFVNPQNTLRLLSKNISGDIIESLVTTTIPRYNFINKNDRILTTQIKDTTYTGSGSLVLDINENELVIFRNIGEAGLDANDIDNKVRTIQRGWGFIDPFYICVIEIEDPNGIEIDVGDKPIIIDDISYTNKIDGLILTGKTPTSTGIHRIKVHKSNWREVTSLATNLVDLKSKDSLYPFNHKLLIEGYVYGPSYPSTEEQVYIGVDIFAEILMRLVSPFDIGHNIASNDFTSYALDRDAPSSHNSGNEPTRVFLVKVDDSNPDFQHERFVIRFKEVNLLKKYLRLRADLATTNDSITPALLSYKIKLR